MSLERTLTHEEIMAAEKEAARNPDVNTPAQDEQWRELQQRLEGQKPTDPIKKEPAAAAAAEDDGAESDEIVEGDEVNSAALAEQRRVFRRLGLGKERRRD